MNILGLSCYFHDAAAALVIDGKLVAAAEEERFSRRKHDPRFPLDAIRYCLSEVALPVDAIDAVAFYEKPLRKLDRQLRTAALAPDRSLSSLGQAAEFHLREGLFVEAVLEREIGYRGPVSYLEHHLSHAASAFYCSPFDEAAILTVDGVGEWATTAQFEGVGNRLRCLREIHYPHSLGLLYAALTAYLGFTVNDDEYKVMGLASYGRPIFRDRVERLLHLHPDGSLELASDFFAFQHDSRQMFAEPLVDLLGPARLKDEPITQRHKDVAASLQVVTEEAVLHLVQSLKAETGAVNLCMAGGVSYNCVANSRVLKDGVFKRVFIQPAAGDSGAAVGAALYLHHQHAERIGQPRHATPRYDTRLGPAFDDDGIREALKRHGVSYRHYDQQGLCDETAALIDDDRIVGWFQGRLEFGPRALGGRSILANPCNPDMMDILNARVKFREDFRPFAPAVLEERAADYFELDGPSPYMLLTPHVRPERRSEIPSVTHVDGTARVQTVSQADDPLFHRLITAFGALSGTPVVMNTSFNVRGEPIVCTPDDAIRCFLHTNIDHLAIGSFIVAKP